MVKNIEDYNIPKNTTVILSYGGGYEYIALWNYKNEGPFKFISPHTTVCERSSYPDGSFRFNDGCKLLRFANIKEKLKLQSYLDKMMINFKVPMNNIYELW